MNTYFAWLTEQVGADRVVEMAERLGIMFRADSDARLARDGAANWGPFTLGVAATTPLDLANAYATVAAEGTWCAPLPVVSITDATGRPVAAGDTGLPAGARHRRGPGGRRRGPLPGGRPVDVRAAATAARRRPARPGCGRPVAGKTGSSERNATETVVAFTPQLAVAAIAANPDDPRDAVGAAVQTRMVDAVGRILAVGPARPAGPRLRPAERVGRLPAVTETARTGN